MENLIFSLNATMPVFLLMVLGFIFHLLGWIDNILAEKLNKFVFLVPLPVLVFEDLATVDISQTWDFKLVLFCFIATLISIFIAAAISLLLKDRDIRGEFIQVSYRSSAAILGLALVTNIYGDSGMVPLMIIGSVPLYNIAAVVILQFLRPGKGKITRALILNTLKGVITNPIILAIIAGIIWSALGIPMPAIMEKTVSNIAGIATPLGLLAMGASFSFKQAAGRLRPAIAAAFMKLAGFVIIFIPIAVMLGFRDQALVSILIMLGSCSTVTCFVMARNYGHEGILTSNTVMITTLFSAFSLTLWLFILRSMGFI